MTRYRDLPIPRKLTWLSTITTATALLLVGTAFLVYEVVSFRDGLARRLQAEADLIGFNTSAALLFEDPEHAAQTLSGLSVEASVRRAAIFNREGELFASYVREGVAPPPPSIPTDVPRTGKTDIDASLLRVTRPIVVGDEIIGYVRITSDFSELGARLRQVSVIGLVASLVAFLAALALASRFERSIAGPILQLAGTARRVALERDYRTRAESMGRDEIGILTEAFNDMLGQIQAREEALQRARGELETRVEERTRDLRQEVIERKHAEQALTAANRELEAFSYSVSHDLRAPLRAIHGFCEALVLDYRDRLDETGKDYLNRVVTAAKKMSELVEDLLKFSRVGRTEMHHEDVDLGALATQIAGELRDAEPGRDVTFHIASDLVARGDRALLRVALENLLANAWKFTSHHASARIEVGRAEADGRTAFYVRDDGAGFDPADSAKLFAPFERLHPASQFAGTGIGLAIVHRIVARHGGRIWARGEVDRGATFYFELGNR